MLQNTPQTPNTSTTFIETLTNLLKETTNKPAHQLHNLLPETIELDRLPRLARWMYDIATLKYALIGKGPGHSILSTDSYIDAEYLDLAFIDTEQHYQWTPLGYALATESDPIAFDKIVIDNILNTKKFSIPLNNLMDTISAVYPNHTIDSLHSDVLGLIYYPHYEFDILPTLPLTVMMLGEPTLVPYLIKYDHEVLIQLIKNEPALEIPVMKLFSNRYNPLKVLELLKLYKSQP